jgi:hypothetical protein
VADAVNDLFTAKFLQIVGGVARAVLLAMTGPSYTVKNIEAIAEGSDMRARLYTLVPGDVIPWDRRIPRRQQHQERRLRALQVKHHFVVAVGGDVRDILVPGLAWIGCRTQHRKLSRPGGDPDRSDEGNLDRRRTRNGRNGELVSQGHPQRLPNRRQRHRSGVDDPDQQFFENYGCRSARGGKHSSSNLGDQVLALATGKTQQEIAAACKGARANHVGAALSRHKRTGRIEERDGKLYAISQLLRDEVRAILAHRKGCPAA